MRARAEQRRCACPGATARWAGLSQFGSVPRSSAAEHRGSRTRGRFCSGRTASPAGTSAADVPAVLSIRPAAPAMSRAASPWKLGRNEHRQRRHSCDGPCGSIRDAGQCPRSAGVDVEVLLVNQGSNDLTSAVVAAAARSDPASASCSRSAGVARPPLRCTRVRLGDYTVLLTS